MKNSLIQVISKLAEKAGDLDGVIRIGLGGRRESGRARSAVLAGASLLFFLAASAFPQTVQSNLPITDGPLYSVLLNGNTLYISGSFNHVGPYTGGFVVTDSATGTRDASYPAVNGVVYAIVSDGSGGWFIGGTFTRVGGVTRNNIAHILPDKSLDLTWDPNANSSVRTIALQGSTVFVGGYFTSIGDSSRSYVAELDASTGKATAWNPSPNGPVLDMAADGSALYFGGYFTTVGGQTRNYLASAAISDGSVTSWNPDANGGVMAMTSVGPTIYVGGSFDRLHWTGTQVLRGQAAAIDTNGNILTWDPQTGPSSGEQVLAIASTGNTIYLGGQFTDVHDNTTPITRNHLVAVDTAGNVLAWNPDVNGNVWSLAVSGNMVYAGGDFSTVEGGSVSRPYAVAVDTDGTVSPWNPEVINTVYSFAGGPSTVLLGGTFTSSGAVMRNNLAAVNVSTGEVTGWNPNANGVVESMALYGSKLYFGGEFSTVGDSARNDAAAVDTGSGAVSAWDPEPNSDVYSFAASGSRMFVGGDFTVLGSTPRNYIASVDTSSGTPDAWDPNDLNSDVNTLVISGSTLYAGGYFGPTSGDSVRNYAIAYNVNSASVTGWNPNPDSYINTFALSGSLIYVGGDFATIGGQTRSYIAAVDTGAGDATSWNPGADNDVQVIALSSGAVYAGGYFSNIGGQAISGLAAIDRGTGAAEASWNPNASNASSIAVNASNSTVYAGGTFSTFFGIDHQYLAGATNPADASLPVQAVGFRAVASTGSVTLTWQTQSEVGNAGFNILRQQLQTTDQGPRTTPWQLISSYTGDDSLRGLGTSSTGRSYDFTDNRVISGDTYLYRIQSVSISGVTQELSTLTVEVDVPKTFALYQNYPNPFNPTTAISYELSANSYVTLKVYDILGREVATLVNGQQNAGAYKVNFNASRFASGVYFYRIDAVGKGGQSFAAIKKLMLVK